MQEHEAILNALLRHDGTALSHVLRRHLRHKREAIERAAGFAEAEEKAESGGAVRRGERTAVRPNRLGQREAARETGASHPRRRSGLK